MFNNRKKNCKDVRGSPRVSRESAHSFIIVFGFVQTFAKYSGKMPSTRSVSHKGKRRADSIEGQLPQVSAPSAARPAKKRKLEETDASELDAGTLITPSQTYPTARTKRRSEELMRRRRRARLLQRASTQVEIQPDKLKSPSPVALPTPNSVKEEPAEDDDPVAEVKAVGRLATLQAELAAKDRVGGIPPFYELSGINTDMKMSRRSSMVMSSRFKLSRTLFNAKSVLNRSNSLTRMF